MLWRTARLSWDGIGSVRIEGAPLRGEAWSPDDRWMPSPSILRLEPFKAAATTRPETTQANDRAGWQGWHEEESRLREECFGDAE